MTIVPTLWGERHEPQSKASVRDIQMVSLYIMTILNSWKFCGYFYQIRCKKLMFSQTPFNLLIVKLIWLFTHWMNLVKSKKSEKRTKAQTYARLFLLYASSEKWKWKKWKWTWYRANKSKREQKVRHFARLFLLYASSEKLKWKVNVKSESEK